MSIRRKQHPSQLILPLIAGLSFLISDHTQAAEPTQGAILYSEANFGGVSWSVGEGQYDSRQDINFSCVFMDLQTVSAIQLLLPT